MKKQKAIKPICTGYVIVSDFNYPDFSIKDDPELSKPESRAIHKPSWVIMTNYPLKIFDDFHQACKFIDYYVALKQVADEYGHANPNYPYEGIRARYAVASIAAFGSCEDPSKFVIRNRKIPSKHKRNK